MHNGTHKRFIALRDQGEQIKLLGQEQVSLGVTCDPPNHNR